MTGKSVNKANPAYQQIISPEHEGQRIDNFLTGHLKGVPRSRIYRMLRQGEVRVNKGRVRQDYRLHPGDSVRIPPLRRNVAPAREAPNEGFARTIQGAILTETVGWLALNKPAGIAVHGGSGRSYGIIELLRTARPQARFLELVHRLDRDTSGCLLIAKTRPWLRQLQEGFRERRVEKRYLVLVRGPWQGGTRTVEAPLRRRIVPSGERVVGVHWEGKPAFTSLRPLAAGLTASLLQARTLTGRMHQIRAHAMVAGYPVAGDVKYGDREFNRTMRDHGLRRLFLHASSITCRRADGSTLLRVDTPLPPELRTCLRRVGLDWHDTSPP